MSNNFLNKSISKTHSKFIQFLFIISCLLCLINCQENDSEKKGLIFDIGKGTFAIIIFIALGVLICIFGLAFSSPGIFVFIGILLPLIAFIFCIALPREDKNKQKENEIRNNYIIARWVYFTFMLLFFLGLFVPAFFKWNITVIPQRVNSNAMKDTYDEKYLEDLEKQKKRKYNLENDIFEDERLPLSSKKKKRSNFIERDDDDDNNNNNRIDNNLDQSGNLPIGRIKKKNEINDNRKKFKGFKRKDN